MSKYLQDLLLAIEGIHLDLEVAQKAMSTVNFQVETEDESDVYENKRRKIS